MQTPNRIEDCLREWNRNVFFRWMLFCSVRFCSVLFCLFVFFIALAIVSVGKRKVAAVMTFSFFPTLFWNKLKHPSVGASINFESKHFAASRALPTKTKWQSFFFDAHKVFIFWEIISISFYYSMTFELTGQSQWTLISIYKNMSVAVNSRKSLLNDRRKKERTNEKRTSKGTTTKQYRLFGLCTGTKVPRSLVDCSAISVCALDSSLSH